MQMSELVPQGDVMLSLEAEWGKVQALLLEELSMWPPSWLWALAYRLGHIRKGLRHVDPADPLHCFFAGVELVRINADFLQLPPSTVHGHSEGARAVLCANVPLGTGDVWARIFCAVHHLELGKTTGGAVGPRAHRRRHGEPREERPTKRRRPWRRPAGRARRV